MKVYDPRSAASVSWVMGRYPDRRGAAGLPPPDARPTSDDPDPRPAREWNRGIGQRGFGRLSYDRRGKGR